MNAVNHAGWNVEYLSRDGRGWVAVGSPYHDKRVADTVCEIASSTMPNTEFRVYEALTTKENR